MKWTLGEAQKIGQEMWHLFYVVASSHSFSRLNGLCKSKATLYGGRWPLEDPFSIVAKKWAPKNVFLVTFSQIKLNIWENEGPLYARRLQSLLDYTVTDKFSKISFKKPIFSNQPFVNICNFWPKKYVLKFCRDLFY